MPPVSPMLAKAVRDIPPGMQYEAKWDGFRAIVFRDGHEVELGSRNERPMTRYFPELVESLKANLPERCVVDGEVVIVQGDRLEFESLLQRIHPADCVVAGFRWHKTGPIVGSLLLGLYNDAGHLQHVGVAASFPVKRRTELVDELKPYEMHDFSGHPWAEWAQAEAHMSGRMPGAL